MTFLVKWHCWQYCQHYLMPMTSWMTPSHSLDQDIQSEVQHYFLDMWCHWHWLWCHMMPMVSSVAPSHSLGQDDWKRCNIIFFGHVTALEPAVASHDASGIIDDTTAFLRSRQLSWDTAWIFWLCDAQWHWHHMTQLALSVVHGTDASTVYSHQHQG